MYQNSSILGTNYYIGKPTQAAVDNSDIKSSGLSSTNYWQSWLRSPDADYSIGYAVRIVFNAGFVGDTHAFYSGVGVRPAFYINLSSVIFKSGNGLVETPYIVATDLYTVSGEININNSNLTNDLEVTFTNVLTKKQYSVLANNVSGQSRSFDVRIADKGFYKIVVKRSGYLSYIKENIEFTGEATFNAQIFPGDLDNDERVNIYDVSVILKYYGQRKSVMSDCDFNEDGIINVSDISITIGNLGRRSIVE